jgi:prevent-host-death family protein
VTEARARSSDVVDHARVAHDPTFLTRRGRRVAAVVDAVVDADMLEQLVEPAEGLSDLRAAAAAWAEMCEPIRPDPRGSRSRRTSAYLPHRGHAGSGTTAAQTRSPSPPPHPGRR